MLSWSCRMPVRRSLSKEPTQEPGRLFRIRQIIQVMDRQQTFHRRQNVVPVTEPESARNARVVQHLVSVVEDLCGRPAAPVEAVADRPVPDVAAAVWMLPAEPAADIVEAVVEIPASSAAEAAASLVVSVMARV